MNRKEMVRADHPGDDAGTRPRFTDNSRRLVRLARTALEFGGVLLLAAPFFWLTARNYLHLDLWFDEILSLDRFILVPFTKTVTDYSSTNNHIFFSILTSSALRILGYRELFQLLERPWVVRALMLVVGTATIIAVYAVGRRFFGRITGALAAIILASTVPFYNFAVQVRGYTLSMALLCLLLFFVWSLEERPSARSIAGVTLATALLLYTIFVNFYAVAAILLCQGACLIAHLPGRKRSSGGVNRAWRTHATVMLACAAGIGLWAILFAPMFKSFFSSPYLKPSPEFHSSIFLETLPDIMRHFLSGRWGLLAAVPFAIAAVAHRARTCGDSALLKKYLLLGAVLLLPFLFSFLRRDRILERAFVNLAPVAALFLALNCRLALAAVIKSRRTVSLVVVAGISAYCALEFTAEVARKDRFLLERANATTFERRTDTLYANYYQAGYQPAKIVQMTKDFLARHRAPLPVFLAGRLDRGVLPRHFLVKAGIDFLDLRDRKPRDYPAFREALFLVTHPPAFEALVERQLPATWCRRVNSETMLANLYYCRQSPE